MARSKNNGSTMGKKGLERVTQKGQNEYFGLVNGVKRRSGSKGLVVASSRVLCCLVPSSASSIDAQGGEVGPCQRTFGNKGKATQQGSSWLCGVVIFSTSSPFPLLSLFPAWVLRLRSHAATTHDGPRADGAGFVGSVEEEGKREWRGKDKDGRGATTRSLLSSFEPTPPPSHSS